ncbi:MAG TPA: hypothetical protein ENG83_04120 [Nitrospirae bacterium]|nr:hypothetical protein BMS3Abin06_00388 [bacterium BMS3Abin06]HDH11376.1 hypothetical protein [Nitrospirota bacterium]HDZ03359.1 hypothetical protein [Nitrospirota bacterium]
MKKNKLKSMTITEASDYFDDHDIFESEDFQEVTDIKIKLQKKKYVGVNMQLFKKIRNKARKLHISEDALIQKWLKEKVG